MTQLRPYAAAVVAVACVAAVLPFTVAGAAGGPATSVRTTGPVNAAGALETGYHVVRRLDRGVCQHGSFMTGVADRCAAPQAGANVLDPCWPTADRTVFVCEAKPWDHDVVKLRVGSVSGGPGRHRPALPWGLRIGSTIRCLLDPGSVRKLYGRPLLFHCSHRRDVFAPLRRSGPLWKAHVYKTGAATATGYRSLGWQPVTIAWYGAPVTPAPTTSPTPTVTPTTTPSLTPTPTPTS